MAARSIAQSIIRAESKSKPPVATTRRISARFESEVAEGSGHAKARDAGEAAGAGHVVEAGAGVEVMATAGASANRRAVAMAAVGKNVTAGANN